ALAAEDLAGSIGEDLVHVHVGLRARTGLPNDERELDVVLSGNDLVGGGDDGVGLGFVEDAELEVHLRGGALDLSESANEAGGHAVGADLEVLQRPLRLRAPEAVGGDLDGAERVLFDSMHAVFMHAPRHRINAYLSTVIVAGAVQLLSSLV